jgi:hypothetical protein
MLISFNSLRSLPPRKQSVTDRSLEIGTLEHWNDGFWETGVVLHRQNPIDRPHDSNTALFHYSVCQIIPNTIKKLSQFRSIYHLGSTAILCLAQKLFL